MKTCLDCAVPLTETNWTPSAQRQRRYLCGPCAVARATAHVAENREKVRQRQAAYYRAHKAEFALKSKAYHKAHPDKAREWARRSQKKHRAAASVRQRAWRQRHLVRLAATAKTKREAIRAETLRAYGNACKCCGVTEHEFLAVDHTNGDGSAHRREMSPKGKNSGTAIYGWLKRHGFPQDRFRLLCHNCNNARAWYGYCPHDRERAAAV